MDFYIVHLSNNCDPLLKTKVQISKSIHSALCKCSSIDRSSLVVAGPVAVPRDYRSSEALPGAYPSQLSSSSESNKAPAYPDNR